MMKEIMPTTADILFSLTERSVLAWTGDGKDWSKRRVFSPKGINTEQYEMD